MSTSLEAGVQIGDVQIIKRLGAGGMGIVYLARQVSLDRLAVTKALLPVGWRNRAVSADLEGVVHKTPAKDPDLRYDSAAGLATDLPDHLDGKPVSAPPYRFRPDERQIVAERPGLVAFAGYLVAVIATAHAMLQLLFLSETLPIYRSGEASRGTFLIQAAGLLLIPTYYLAGLSILNGRRYFVGVSTLLSITLLGTSSCVVILGAFGGLKPLPLLLMMLGPFTLVILIGLLVQIPPESRKWFSLAERLRSEHTQQAPP